MDKAKKSELIHELSKAIAPDDEQDEFDDGRAQFRPSTRTLEINDEARFSEEDQEIKQPSEDEMFDSLIEKLNIQKYGFDKRHDV